MNHLKNEIRKIYATSLITSIIMLILGILLLSKPDFIISLVSAIVGVMILIPGIVSLVDYFKTKYQANLLIGVILSILGVLFIFNAKFISSILPFALGIYFVMNGIQKLQYAIELRHHQIVQSISTIITSIFIVLCGILMIVNPFGGALAITQILGIFMILYSLLNIYNATSIRRAIKNVSGEF
ncbi:MAG: DUF308 domain-containing protein [bacterium]|nr:DUF308 domain-containing protein [bacterium]